MRTENIYQLLAYVTTIAAFLAGCIPPLSGVGMDGADARPSTRFPHLKWLLLASLLSSLTLQLFNLLLATVTYCSTGWAVGFGMRAYKKVRATDWTPGLLPRTLHPPFL